MWTRPLFGWSAIRLIGPVQAPSTGAGEADASCVRLGRGAVRGLRAGYRSVPVANLVEETFGSFLDKVQGVLEPARSAAVGVGHLGLGSRSIVQEGSYDRPSLADPRNRPVVRLVHRQDVVEPPAVFGVEQACPLARDVDSSGEDALLCQRVRRLPGGVEAVGAGGIDGYLVGQPLAPRYVLEDALRHRAAADVSRTDEKDTNHRCDSRRSRGGDQMKADCREARLASSQL